jgi:hypothetical protein
MRRTRIVIVGLACALLVGVGSALAATIVGTSGNDTLRGTPSADRLDGKAGNDKLLGRGGNDLLLGGPGADLLVGGPGADRLVCGLGRDIARADARDTVARDCETVKGLGPPPQPTTPGTYCGVTSQDMTICLDVESGAFGIQIVSGIRLSVQTTCQPSRQLAYTYALITQAGVQADRTFASNVSFPGFAASVAGAFDVSRMSAAGSLRVQVVDRRAGAEYECDSGTVSWTAKTPPAEPSAQHGRFCGFTDQGLGLCLDVAGSPKTVTNLELFVRTECTPPAPFVISSTIPIAYAIRDDNTFAFERTVTGTTGSGGSFTATHTMLGAFDASGTTATGTLAAHLTYEAGDGVHFECDSQTFSWSVYRQ